MTAMTAKQRIEARRGTIAQNRSKGLRPYKFKNGVTKFRILPAADPSQPWERPYGKTYLKSFDKQNFFGIVDRQVTYGEATDPIRDLIFDAMRQAPDQDIKDHYREMLAGNRYVFQALILDDKDQDPTSPVIIEVSEGALDNIMAQFAVWAEIDEDHDLASLDRGHVIQVEKTGTGLDTKYTYTATPQPAPLNPKILEKAIDLDAWIASQVDGLESKAIEFIQRLNAAVGIVTSPSLIAAASATRPAALTDQSAATTTPTATTATTTAPQNISAAAVTTVIDETPLEVAAETVQPEPVVNAEVPHLEAEVVTPTPAPTPAATPATDTSEIDDILASLG